MGVDPGPDLVPPRFDNPKGFREHREIRDRKTKFREEPGSFWHDIRSLPHERWLSDTVKEFVADIPQMLRRDFTQAKLFGVKDPRMCRPAKVRHQAFAEVKCKPHCVLMFRNPLEVTASSSTRDQPAEILHPRSWNLTALLRRIFSIVFGEQSVSDNLSRSTH